MKKQVSFVLFLSWFSITWFKKKKIPQVLQKNFILIQGTPESEIRLQKYHTSSSTVTCS